MRAAIHRSRVLFIIKRRHDYDPCDRKPPMSSGLRNSVIFVVQLLEKLGIQVALAEVNDNNDIDREVTAYQPSHVFIEALWVVPSKFDVLQKLHPDVRWIVRLHSEMPFLSNEGIAVEWITGYLRRGIEVNCNSVRAQSEIALIAHVAGVSEQLVTYLPNYYPPPGADSEDPRPQQEAGAVHIGCFGAIRPLKNQMNQALAAIAFADDYRFALRFHINSTRPEGGGEPILANLRQIFAIARRHELVEHPWLDHDDFLVLMQQMDIALQVSFSETFNIVSADAVDSAVPLIASPAVNWLGRYALAKPGSVHLITAALRALWEGSTTRRLFLQRRDLSAFCVDSEVEWGKRFG